MNYHFSPLTYITDINYYKQVSKIPLNLPFYGYTRPNPAIIKSGVQPNLIDFESDLKGITRPIAYCDNYKYHPFKN